MPKAHLLLAECIVGEIDKVKNQRAWIMIMPIPFMEVETAGAGVRHAGPGRDERAGVLPDDGVGRGAGHDHPI